MREADSSGRVCRRAADAAAVHAVPVPGGVSAEALAATLTATRRLARAEQPVEAVEAVCDLVHALGGVVVSAWLAPPEALPLDVGLGVVPPRVPLVGPVSVAEMHVRALVPGVVEDARAVVQRLKRSVATTADAVAPLEESALVRRIDLLPRDTPALVLGAGPPRSGPGAGRSQELVRFVRATTRAGDLLGHLDSGALVVVLRGAPRPAAAGRAAQLGELWRRSHPGVPLRAQVTCVGAGKHDELRGGAPAPGGAPTP